MGRRRKPENARYPAGVYASRGWLFWKDPASGAWTKLGKDWDKAARDKWVQLSTGNAAKGTVAALLDAHMAYREQLLRERKLAARTYADNLEYLKPLKSVFGTMPAHQVNGRHCTAYVQKRAWQPPARKGADGTLIEQPVRRAPVRANKELSLLSSAYSWAMSSDEFPDVTANPCVGVERNSTKAKERCPEVWEIEAAKAHAPEPWPWILDLAYKVGARGVQFRLMPKSAIRPDGLYIGKAKNGVDVIVEWDDELIGTVLALLAHTDAIERERRVASPYLILARGGGPYTAQGWKTTVYKFVRAALGDAANPLKVPFSFHDIRARSATDDDELYGRNPKDRLGHLRQATTDDYMRGRRARRVKPLPLLKAS